MMHLAKRDGILLHLNLGLQAFSSKTIMLFTRLRLFVCCIYLSKGICFSPKPFTTSKSRIGSSSHQRYYFSSSQDDTVNTSSSRNDNRSADNHVDRLRRAAIMSIPLSLLVIPNQHAAHARGLVQFPCVEPLLNTYHMMRAGVSLLEEEDIWSTNPLFLTNREDALSPYGTEQVIAACKKIAEKATSPTVLRYSLAASCIDTANIIGRELKIGRDRLVPEFTFMDPRAIGQWDMQSKASTQPAVWAMDVAEAGPDGVGGRPPPNDDGTPHETLADQSVRLRQLLSVLESQYSGDTILLIFPDGTGPALLTAMIGGIPYNRVHELEFASGEIRLDVNYQTANEVWKSKQGDETYAALIAEGRETLTALRKGRSNSVNKKDQKIEEERLAIDREMERKQQKRLEAEQAIREQRLKNIAEGGGGAEVSPLVLGAIGALAIGGTVLVGGGRRDDDDVVVDEGATGYGLAFTNGSAVTGASMTGVETEISGSNSDKTSMANRESAVAVNGASTGSLYSTPVMTYEERQKAAADAMQKYLDEDDGGEAWLQAMAEIIQESDEEEEEDLNS